jgi:hypothetical protein
VQIEETTCSFVEGQMANVILHSTPKSPISAEGGLWAFILRTSLDVPTCAATHVSRMTAGP